MMRHVLSLMLACGVMTGGCGLRGPLYLPDGQQTGAPQTAQPAPAGNATSGVDPESDPETEKQERDMTDPAAAPGPAAN